MMQIKTALQLGQIIRTTRKNQGLTQLELAATCGIGLRFLRELEHGKESCHLAKTLFVLKMLGIDIFLEGGGSIN